MVVCLHGELLLERRLLSAYQRQLQLQLLAGELQLLEPQTRFLFMQIDHDMHLLRSHKPLAPETAPPTHTERFEDLCAQCLDGRHAQQWHIPVQQVVWRL